MKSFDLVKIATLALAVTVSHFALAETVNASETIGQMTDQVVQSAQSTMKDWSQKTKEVWRQGKLESVYVLNSHLSAYNIHTRVHGEKVYLSGIVGSEVEKELAEELAISVDSIESVENNLMVNAEYEKTDTKNAAEKSKNIGAAVADATATASIKMKIISSEVKARNINVDTDNGVVTLSGSTESEIESNLAEHLARNTKGIREVHNNLKIADLQ